MVIVLQGFKGDQWVSIGSEAWAAFSLRPTELQPTRPRLACGGSESIELKPGNGKFSLLFQLLTCKNLVTQAATLKHKQDRFPFA